MSETTSFRLMPSHLEELNARLEKLSPMEIVKWAADRFGKRLGILSAMQQAGCALCHMAASQGLAGTADVVFVDTGVNFPETMETVERIRGEYKLNVVSLHPARTMAEQIAEEGVLYVTTEGQKKCCDLRKKKPLRQIVGRYDALLSSLRRGSGGMRSDIPVLALDKELNLIRVHPLLKVGDEELDAYIRENKVIVNPLHEQGYPTVSCNRCTTPVLAGEDDRAGRWRHLENAAKYCNINPTDRKRISDGSDFVELSIEVAEKMLNFEI
jgi:phosphoadenosine phosphosulfate reductase